MPPKVKYTKKDVVDAALLIVREEGEGSLSARRIAARMGCSTAPIFSCFADIAELRLAVLSSAFGVYKEYFARGLSEEKPFLGIGVAYLRFAMDESHFFKMLFMSPGGNEGSGFFPSGDPDSGGVIEMIAASNSISRKSAAALYNHISVYNHGLATMLASGQRVFDISKCREMLSEMFYSLLNYYKEKESSCL